MQATREQFTLNQHLSDLFRKNSRMNKPPLENPGSLVTWQRQGRKRVEELLGIAGLPRPKAVQQEHLHSRNRGNFIEEKWAITTDEAVSIPIYFLVPQISELLPPVLVFHGHNPSVQYILGNYPDFETEMSEKARDGNYAEQIAAAGHFVCAVEQRAFGERLTQSFDDGASTNSCRHMSFYYQMLGRNLVGERCRDGMVALDLMRTRPEIRGSKVAVTGNSGGGTTSLYLGAIEESLDVVITGCYLCSFEDSIMAIRHCECNYVPGVAKEFEMGDIASLIAPRPQLFIQGEFDDIFPVAASRSQFGLIQQFYDTLSMTDRVQIAVHPTGHAYNTESALAFLKSWM